MVQKLRTDAIMEGEMLGSGFMVQNPRYGFWVNSVNVLEDLTGASLAELVSSENPTCGDRGNTEPLLNYLRNLEENQHFLDWKFGLDIVLGIITFDL